MVCARMSTKQESPFHPVATKRRALLVVEQILDAISNRSLNPGDRLPSERDLAEQVGVSRPSVREALSTLQVIGALETRHGQGTFVRDRAQDVPSFLGALNELYDSDGLAETLELRRVIDKSTAFLLVDRVSESRLETLRHSLDEMRTASLGRDFDAFNVANGKFHEAFMLTAENSLLYASFSSINGIMLSRLGRVLRRVWYEKNPAAFNSSLKTHEDIVAALEIKDITRLLEAIDAHYDEIEQSL